MHGLYSAINYVDDGFALEGYQPQAPRELLGICAMDMPEAVLDWVRKHVPAGASSGWRQTVFR